MFIRPELIVMLMAAPASALTACAPPAPWTIDSTAESTTGHMVQTTAASMEPIDTDTGSAPVIDEPLANSVFAVFVGADGQPLPDAWIRPLRLSEAPEELPPLHADPAGQVLAEALPGGEQRWIIGAPGHASRTVVFFLDADIRTHLKFRLTPRGETFQIDTEKFSELDHKNVRIVLPPGHMIKKFTGERHTGPALAAVTVINPTADNQESPPVPMAGEDLTGDQWLLESFGMVGVELTTMDGQPLELNDDVQAEVSFTLPEELAARVKALGLDSTPAWHADPDKGEVKWTEFGTFHLTENAQGDIVASSSEVKKFSWINTDIKLGEPSCYVIKVIDAKTKKPLSGLPVELKSDNIPYYGVTSGAGTVCFELAPLKSGAVDIEGLQPFTVTSMEMDPKSVCLENNWTGYKNYLHGKCTVLVKEVGADKTCVPGSTWDCSVAKPYIWAGSTLNVGLCKGAFKYCINGAEWGPCVDPVGPKDEVCSPDSPQFDENCDGLVNEGGDGCVCDFNKDPPQPCYPGDPQDLMAVDTACKPGLQACSPQGWSECMGFTAPDPDAETCTPKHASCADKPCDFDPLWWHSMGKSGRHTTLDVHLQGSSLSHVSHVALGGDTSTYGPCFKPGINKFDSGFEGFVLGKYIIGDPVNCQNPNIIKGKIDDNFVHADISANGAAVAGKATSTVEKDTNGKILGCEKEISAPGAGAYLVSRFDKNNGCMFRQYFDGAQARIVDVAMGAVPDTVTYIAGVVEAGKMPVLLPSLAVCNIPVNNQQQGFYAKLYRDAQLKMKCEAKVFAGETPLAIGASGASLAVVARNDTDVVLRLVNLETLATTWSKSVMALNDVNPATFTPLSIATRDQKIAITGLFSGTPVIFGKAYDAEGPDSDFLLLVSDPSQPSGGMVRVGSGDALKDAADFGSSVAWVDLLSPPGVGLVVAGNSASPNFFFDDCWSKVNPDGGKSWDSFVATLRYDAGVLTCVDHHPLTGAGDQTVNSISVDSLRVGLGGRHSGKIIVGGDEVEGYTGAIANAHVGVTKMPVQPAP